MSLLMVPGSALIPVWALVAVGGCGVDLIGLC